jgi:hypothetical protein
MLYSNWSIRDKEKVFLCTHEDDSIPCKNLWERWWYIWNPSYHKIIKTMLHTASILVTVWHTLPMEWKVYLTLNIEGLSFFFPAETWATFFYYSSFCAVGFVEFVSSLINLFSCLSQQVCSLFKKKTQNFHECGLSEIWTSQIIGLLKYVSPYCIILTSSFTTEQKISNYICVTPKDI